MGLLNLLTDQNRVVGTEMHEKKPMTCEGFKVGGIKTSLTEKIEIGSLYIPYLNLCCYFFVSSFFASCLV